MNRRDVLLTSAEARQYLKIGRTKLWQLTKESVVPAYRLGRGKSSSLRYRKSELLKWLRCNRAGQQAPEAGPHEL